MIFLTSDTHFGHKNAIKNSRRPFTTLEEMEETLIERWNNVIQPHDLVYHLGDFGMCNDLGHLQKIFDRLVGIKYLIKGNHDKVIPNGWAYVYEGYADFNLDGVKFTLCHYPMFAWNCSFHGAYHFHGHVHGTPLPIPNALDVGVDSNFFTPIDLDTALNKILQRGHYV